MFSLSRSYNSILWSFKESIDSPVIVRITEIWVGITVSADVFGGKGISKEFVGSARTFEYEALDWEMLRESAYILASKAFFTESNITDFLSSAFFTSGLEGPVIPFGGYGIKSSSIFEDVFLKAGTGIS